MEYEDLAGISGTYVLITRTHPNTPNTASSILSNIPLYHNPIFQFFDRLLKNEEVYWLNFESLYQVFEITFRAQQEKFELLPCTIV